MPDFEITKCGRADYPEFLAAIDRAFGFEPDTFISNLSHILPPPAAATESDTTKNLIAVSDGKIKGAAGFYPMQNTASDATATVTFKLCGVGQVSCLPEYRKQGVMSALLNRGIEEMRNDGFELSWLGGERARYGRFGYEVCGCRTVYHLMAKDLAKTERLSACKIYEPSHESEEHIRLLDGLYAELPTRVLRDKTLWQRHLSRQNFQWLICELDGKTGYLCRQRVIDNPLPGFSGNELLEVSGDPDCVLNLLYMHTSALNLTRIELPYPFCPTSLAKRLYQIANYFTLKPSGQIKIIDPDSVYEKLLPFIKRQCRSQQELSLIRSEPGDIATKTALARKMLGFTYHILPENLVPYDFLRPMSLCIPNPDEV